mmetsp:Transcript_36431/g.82333  ORF Transcript_36431/g.82333 Transcript_36431/m.82333 type:complete len:280 (-) Transcript_36431:9-848(-)
MTQGVFSVRTLNDNWFEDRHQPGDSLCATAGFHRRKARGYETDLAYIGDRYDVLSRISRMPDRVSYATPDDGFNEKSKTSLVDFAHPLTRTEFSKGHQSAPSLINTANAPVCPPERRPVPGPRSGFGAVLNRHPDSHDRRFFNTTAGDFFGDDGVRRRPPRSDPAALRPAGVSSESVETRGEGVKTGKLAGECFYETSNPAMDTRTQRSWLYSQDASLKHIEYGGTKRILPKTDSALSLPLGEGAMSKVRSELKSRGSLARTSTYITKQKKGYTVFQDG